MQFNVPLHVYVCVQYLYVEYGVLCMIWSGMCCELMFLFLCTIIKPCRRKYCMCM